MKFPFELIVPSPMEAEAAFVESMLKFLRVEIGDWVQFDNDEILRERIKSGLRRAQSHGFTWKSSIAKFVTLMFRFCPNFDRYPAVAAILKRKDIDSESRADLFFTDISPVQWVEIEELYEPAAWQEFATGPVL